MEAIPRQREENAQVRADAKEPLERRVHLSEEGQGGEGSGPSELGASKQGRNLRKPQCPGAGPRGSASEGPGQAPAEA